MYARRSTCVDIAHQDNNLAASMTKIMHTNDVDLHFRSDKTTDHRLSKLRVTAHAAVLEKILRTFQLGHTRPGVFFFQAGRTPYQPGHWSIHCTSTSTKTRHGAHQH